MAMESGLQELSGIMNALSHDDFYTGHNICSSLGLGESHVGQGHNVCRDFPYDTIRNGNLISTSSNATMDVAADSREDSEIFSDIVLSYISRMLLEEDIDEKVSTYQQEAALRATEKPFYDILSQMYPPFPGQSSLFDRQSQQRPNDSISSQYADFSNLSKNSSGGWLAEIGSCYKRPYHLESQCSESSNYASQSSLNCSHSSVSSTAESCEECNMAKVPSLFFERMPSWHFETGAAEARRFLPKNDKLVIELEADGASTHEMLRTHNLYFNSKGEVDEKEASSNGSRSRKNPCREELELVEGRCNKQSAFSNEFEDVRRETFDMLLLCQKGKCTNKINELRKAMQNELSKVPQNGQAKGSGGRKARGNKQAKKDAVDLRTLLIHCAQAVATDDRRTSNELLKQIRQHASPLGDGSQRLAHWFADGLEARLAGTGSQIYKTLVAKRTTATDILKAHRLYLAACPFKMISHFFSNQTILNVATKASKLHIIDFGIFFGFQWPCLIQRLANRDQGPPKLRITGIDVPQPGFRPSERIEETGCRLADYARNYNVPFEYQAISSKLETIEVEDLNIHEDEIVIVNCLYRFRNLVDETVVVDSPRNRVLNTIRKMNPAVFIHGIVNGSYSAPFFVTRFREALFHYSSMFDMLENNVPRENEQRLLIERDLFAREALNIIACEGSERVERPETYKQWQVRNLRARFTQLPLDPDIMKKAKDKARAYHKDFVIDEDNRWLLMGWKGRIVYAISAWRPDKRGHLL